MKCNVCGKNVSEFFKGTILNKYEIQYYWCPYCEHLQTQEPYWLDEAYVDAIAKEDTGILRRNINNAVTTASVIFTCFNRIGKYLDFAGGYGILCRLLRDIGIDCVLEDKYCKNLFAQGFEYKNGDEIELVTAYEVLEHLHTPLIELEKLFKISKNIMFSQTTLPIPIPKIKDWWYYAPNSGQHISFYTNKTLDILGAQFGKKHFHEGEFHLFTSDETLEEKFKYAIKFDAQIYAKNLQTI